MTTEYALDMLLKGFKPTDELDFASLARELLAARKVVEAARKRLDSRTAKTQSDLEESLAAYDAATKGE